MIYLRLNEKFPEKFCGRGSSLKGFDGEVWERADMFINVLFLFWVIKFIIVMLDFLKICFKTAIGLYNKINASWYLCMEKQSYARKKILILFCNWSNMEKI